MQNEQQKQKFVVSDAGEKLPQIAESFKCGAEPGGARIRKLSEKYWCDFALFSMELYFSERCTSHKLGPIWIEVAEFAKVGIVA